MTLMILIDKNLGELRDTILPDSPIQHAFDYACLYLINPSGCL